MSGRPKETAPAGFTLLEVLVSLVVLGAVVAGLASGIRFGAAAWNAQGRMAATGELDAVDRGLRRLLAGMDPVGDGKEPPLTGSSGAMAFAADLPEAVAPPEGRRAAMRVAVQGGALVLTWKPAPHATPLVPAALTTTLILPGVERVELAYFGDPGQGTPQGTQGAAPGRAAWQQSWSAPRLPALVRVRLVFPPGDRRHWADIVEAPRRTAPP